MTIDGIKVSGTKVHYLDCDCLGCGVSIPLRNAVCSYGHDKRFIVQCTECNLMYAVVIEQNKYNSGVDFVVKPIEENN